jgi:hypothetical protein
MRSSGRTAGERVPAADSHLVAVTRPGGVSIGWNVLAQGLGHLQAGEGITYHGVSRSLEFDVLGYARGALTRWWTVRSDGFAPTAGMGNCQ